MCIRVSVLRIICEKIVLTWFWLSPEVFQEGLLISCFAIDSVGSNIQLGKCYLSGRVIGVRSGRIWRGEKGKEGDGLR